MRVFKYIQPNEEMQDNEIVTVTEEQIKEEYFKHWKDQCTLCGCPEDFLTFENCLEDWITVNWAWEEGGTNVA